MLGLNGVLNSNGGQIIVFKATDTVEDVIKSSCFATATKPRRKIRGFVVIGEADALPPRVLIVGTIDRITPISSTSSATKVFKNTFHECWEWEYSLNILYNLTKSPYKFVTISDIFNPGDIEKVLKTKQFVYVNSLKGGFNMMLPQTTSLAKGIV